jgi:hypothetical protein
LGTRRKLLAFARGTDQRRPDGEDDLAGDWDGEQGGNSEPQQYVAQRVKVIEHRRPSLAEEDFGDGGVHQEGGANRQVDGTRDGVRTVQIAWHPGVHGLHANGTKAGRHAEGC